MLTWKEIILLELSKGKTDNEIFNKIEMISVFDNGPVWLSLETFNNLLFYQINNFLEY